MNIKQWKDMTKEELIQEIEEILFANESLSDSELDIRREFADIEKELNHFKQVYTTKVPEGYKWCSDCGALTPHTCIEKKYNKIYTCDVCDTGEINSWHEAQCDTCGFVFDYDTPMTDTVKDKYGNDVIIHQNPNLVSFRSWPIYSMDCSNAREWEEIYRCPICGNLNDYNDGNC